MKLVKTWIDGLDATLGGFPDRSVILLMGEPGSGHDLLAQQILYLHALKGGKSAYFNTFESETVVKQNFADFGWKVDGLEKAKQWDFVHLGSLKNRQMFQKQISSKMQKGCWTLVDSLSHMLMRQETENDYDIVKTLLEGSRNYGGVHLLILTKGMQNSQTETAIQEFVDGVLELVSQEVGGGINRRIKVRKMKAVQMNRLIPYSITPQGIAVETAVRI